ncbi:preprotein translocase subunit SecE [Candidatus Parcubacteria bacterium]|nr:preprotein translocase subunit SecE [Candidatus Parcubacteria bacterium]
MNIKNNRLINYFLEAKEEIKKVTWLPMDKTMKLTVVVILASLVVAVFLGLVDFSLFKFIEKLITIF